MADDFDPRRVSWVTEPDDLEHLVAALDEFGAEWAFDLETSGLDEHDRRGASVALLSLTDERGFTWIIPLDHPESPWLGSWRAVLRRIATVIVERELALSAHNGKFDCRWVRAHAAVDISARLVWDTQIGAHLLDETVSTRLKDVAPAVFDVPAWDEFDLSAWRAAMAVPLIDLALYAARDTYWTWRLRVHQQALFDQPDPMTADEVELARLGRLATWVAMPTQRTLTGIEQRGIALDEDWTRAALDERESAAAKLADELAGRYEIEREGPPSFAPTSHWFRDWSMAAVDAGDLAVAALTPTGKPQWNRAVLVRQARKGSAVALDLLELRRNVKQAEFLHQWLHLVSPFGDIHANYNNGHVVTGRLSSSNPNMQQVTAALKPAFVPRPGYLFAEFDYSQIELRVAAFLSRSAPMLEAFRRGDDLHALLAARITGKDLADVEPYERQAGKSANFGLLYGMGVYGFQLYAEDVYGVSFTTEEATAVHHAFFTTWEGIGAWHARTVGRARSTGQVTSPIGRVRRLPLINDGNEKLAAFAERAAINAPVQGFASDLLQIASASITGTLPGTVAVRKVRLVGTVHDSILAEVPEHGWERAVAACQERLLDLEAVLARLDCRLDVPLEVSVSVGTRWGLGDVS